MDDDRVYCDFGTFGTACLDQQTGKLIWIRQIYTDYQVGPGRSPIDAPNSNHKKSFFTPLLVEQERMTQFIAPTPHLNGFVRSAHR